MEDEVMTAYEVLFPTPRKMKMNTEKNVYEKVRTELFKLKEQMKESDSYSITVPWISSKCQATLTELGYRIAREKPSGYSNAFYEISWDDTENEGD